MRQQRGRGKVALKQKCRNWEASLWVSLFELSGCLEVALRFSISWQLPRNIHDIYIYIFLYCIYGTVIAIIRRCIEVSPPHPEQAHMIVQWKEEFKRRSRVKCPRSGCWLEFPSIYGVKYHYQRCQGVSHQPSVLFLYVRLFPSLCFRVVLITEEQASYCQWG